MAFNLLFIIGVFYFNYKWFLFELKIIHCLTFWFVYLVLIDLCQIKVCFIIFMLFEICIFAPEIK